MQDSKISIIVPVYNVEKYLSQCLNSLVNQTYKNIEILINNDGSTDSSYEICKTFAQKDKRIKLFSQANKGLSAARNAMFPHVSGEYVMFVDSDDYLALNALERILNLVKDDNVDCISFSYEIVPEETFSLIEINKKDHTKTISAEKHAKRMLRPAGLLSQGCYAWTKLFKSKYLKFLYFPEDMIYEDICAMPQMVLKMDKITETTGNFYFYRRRKGSILHDGNKEKKYYGELNSYVYLYKKLRPQEKRKLSRSIAFTFLYEYYCRKCDIKKNAYDLNSFKETFRGHKIFFWKRLLLGEFYIKGKKGVLFE